MGILAMFSQLAQVVANIGNPAVLLIGDFMLDRYLYGAVLRVSPEAPVPVLKVDSRESRPGGAGSVAVDLSRLGAKVTCLGVVGNDNKADILRGKLTKLQIDVAGLLTVDDRPTTSKQKRLMGLANDLISTMLRASRSDVAIKSAAVVLPRSQAKWVGVDAEPPFPQV